MKRKGFTLIELLIVVAIIAILAAIAVPNFLEAQVRSKVSRVKSDMRSLATALESYAVDHNKYPTYHYTAYVYRGQNVTQFFLGGSATGSPPFDGNPQITTPIAYITTTLEDAFHISEGDDPPDTNQFMYVNWRYGIDVVNPGWESIIPVYGEWRITSGGPDLSRGVTPGDYFITLYDPTNGTVSLGQIHRTSLSPDGIPQGQ
jgi:prepilin-type N-terminal cleavage/methylation domain-containing protein